ncbi:protein NO VEIN domain-containing protein [Cellulomonas sp. CW35]|uniref:protein NO VEIN domain-containing protein n=1 Tax=Cellulomonas sp. CW35 TaxID=3458249 RepID=UPI0040337A63
MAINFALTRATSEDPRVDPMARSWYGWDPTRTDAELWAANRGVWRLDEKSVAAERYATLSFDGVVQVVTRIEGLEPYVDGVVAKKALTGEVLPRHHPVARALLGWPVPAQRNPVAYLETGDVEAAAETSSAVRPSSAASTSGFLLTYNPAVWVWPPDDLTAAIDVTRSGGLYRDSWATGGRTSGVAPGDRAFLLKQGAGQRGVVAAGRFASGVFQAPDFREGSEGPVNYAQVEWDTVLDPDDVLPLDILQARIPDAGGWTPRSSGTRIADGPLAALEKLWAEHLDAMGSGTPTVRRAQGWEANPVLRREVEDAAQARLMEHFRDRGWSVRDTHTTEPYDAVATRGDETRYLEAKGTRTAGDSVLVTRGEVLHARAHPGECVLGILSDVSLGLEGHVDPCSGRLRVLPWDVEAGQLEPTAYAYTPPAG